MDQAAERESVQSRAIRASDQDREAVAVYLESLPPIANPDAKATQAGFD